MTVTMSRSTQTIEHLINDHCIVPGTTCRLPWEDPATAFRSAGTVIPPEIAAKKAAAAIAEAQALADQAQVTYHPIHASQQALTFTLIALYPCMSISSWHYFDSCCSSLFLSHCWCQAPLLDVLAHLGQSSGVMAVRVWDVGCMH